MPTNLPIRRPEPPRATATGNLFMTCAVLAMLAISALLLLLPGGVQPG